MKSTIFQGFEVLAAMKEQKTRFSVRLKDYQTPKEIPESEELNQKYGYKFSAAPQTGRWGFCIVGKTEQAVIEKLICYASPLKVGDKLFVKETWKASSKSWSIDKPDIDIRTIEFKAGGVTGLIERPHKEELPCDSVKDGWRSPVHMPQWASRLALEITGVRVARVKDTTEDEAKQHGCTYSDDYTYKGDFKRIWISKHGQQSWDNNDWIFVFDFKVVK